MTKVRAAFLGFLLSCGMTAATAYPDRPIRLIVPFAPGGATDVAARIVGQQLSAKWGQQVVIENRSGGGGVIGIEAVTKSTPDGYTILMVTNGEITGVPAISSKLRYDPQKELVPIAMVTSAPLVWATNLNSQISSLQELIAAAKARPGELAYASAGNGSSAHLATEQFAAAAGIKLLHVPYRGGAPAATAIMAGDVSVGLLSITAVIQVKDSGKVRLLAVTSGKRARLIADIPTIKETGVLKDFESSIWTALFAPSGTPEPIVSKIQADIIAVLEDPAVVARFAELGADAVGMPGAELSRHIRTEIEHLAKIAKEAGIRLD